MLKNILVLFIFSLTLMAQAQVEVNTHERISLENCGFIESETERQECYIKIFQNLFIEEINAYLIPHFTLKPKTVHQASIEILLNTEGIFELVKINTDNKKIEWVIRRSVEKLEAVLPLQDEEGNNISSSFSMNFTSHVTDKGKLVSGLPKKDGEGLRDEEEVIAFTVIEQVPIYPGCNGGNEELKKCMSTKIQEHILTTFNLSKANNLGLPGGIQRIYVNFKIDRKGHVVDVKSRASHPLLADEAIRVVQSIPQMKPGENQGQTVGVLYSLPIVFMVEEENAKEKRARLKREKRALKKSQ